MNRPALLPPLCLLLACGGPRTDALPTGDGTFASTSTYQPLLDSAGQHRHRVTNVRYLAVRQPARDGVRRPLLRETFVQRCCTEGEREVESSLLLEGLGDAAQPAATPVWRQTFPADAGEVWGDFYRAVERGCCDEADALTYVHLGTGALAFVVSAADRPAAQALATLRVPNSALIRYAGVLDRVTPVEAPEALSDSSVAGVLQYGSGDGPARRFVLRKEGGRGLDYRLDRVTFRIPGRETAADGSVDLWSADGQSDPTVLSGFWILIVLSAYDDPPLTVEIPVTADAPEPGRANLPSGWSLAAGGS